jgi:hypothetical protein
MSLKEQADSRVGVAVVSGGFAVLVAFITGLFNWLGSRPATPEQPPAPVLSLGGSQVSAAQSSADASPPPTTTAALATTPRAAAQPNPLLNFAAFQAVVKDPRATLQAKQQMLEQCAGRRVVWQGYVDERVTMAAETGWTWTIVLCEDADALAQSLFKCPAHCRFRDDPEGKVAALERGQLVTISGVFSDHNVVATELTDCTLLRVQQD